MEWFIGMIAEVFVAAMPESRTGRIVLAVVMVLSVAAVGVIIYLAATGRL